MEAYQKRVIEEKQELDKRLKKLTKFLENPRFVVTSEEINRLERQRQIMLSYSQILGERILAFE